MALYSIGSALALYSLAVEKKWIIINIFILIVNCLAILLTGSRSGILLLLIQIIFLFVLNQAQIGGGKKILLIIGLSMLLLFLLKILPQEVSDRLLGRGELQFTNSTGRDILWENGILAWQKNIFWGNGWGALSCHNTYLTFLVDIGIFGVTIFLFIMGTVVKKAIKKQNVISLLLIVSGIFPSFFIDAQNKRLFWNAMLIPMVILNKQTNENETNNFESTKYIKY